MNLLRSQISWLVLRPIATALIAIGRASVGDAPIDIIVRGVVVLHPLLTLGTDSVVEILKYSQVAG